MKKGLKTIVMSTLALMTAGTVSAQNTVELTVTNIPNSKGKILIATSLGQTAMQHASKGDVTVKVDSVPEGAVSFYILHDENDNMQCDMDGRLPKEYCGSGTVNVKKGLTKATIRLEYIPEKIKQEKKNKEENKHGK